MKPLKQKKVTRKCKAKDCDIRFEPRTSTQLVCSLPCAQSYRIESQAKKWRKEGKVMKDKIKAHSDWLQELQPIFNKWIVLRDKLLPCISCETTKNIRWSCGHYYTVGSYGNLRFHPDNAHKQCWFNCNKNKRGNLAEYTPNLIKKIGIERFRALESQRKVPLKLSIPEIKDLKTHYRKLIKELT